MYNLRYHIASLVSVFLALAVGLVLGGLVVGKGMVDKQEGSLVQGLQDEFTQLRDENRTLQTDNNSLKEFSADLVDQWGAARLNGRTVLVISNVGRDDGLASIKKAVEGAGGRVAVATLLKPQLGLADDATRATIASLAPDPEDIEGSIAASLAAEWRLPVARRPLTEALVKAGLLGLEGLDAGQSSAALVTIASSGSKADEVALAIAKAYANAKGIAIGAQAVGKNTGVASAAANADLSAMDTLGSEIGRFTMVALLTGAETGYYGTGQSAKAPYPAMTSK